MAAMSAMTKTATMTIEERAKYNIASRILRIIDEKNAEYSYMSIWPMFSSSAIVTMKFIEDHIDREWDWDRVIYNPNFKPEFAMAHPEIKWRFSIMSYHPDLTEEVVAYFITGDWYLRILLVNPNISRQFMLDNWDIMMRAKGWDSNIKASINYTHADYSYMIEDFEKCNPIMNERKMGMRCHCERSQYMLNYTLDGLESHVFTDDEHFEFNLYFVLSNSSFQLDYQNEVRKLKLMNSLIGFRKLRRMISGLGM
jgi:hypothetical protein